MSVRHDVEAGQAVYTPLTLKIYDIAVLGLSNRFLWRCPTSRLEALYNRNVRDRHIDIGVGTGYFLDKAVWPSPTPQITLVDLNPHSLEAAAQRIRRYNPTQVTANIFEPLPVGHSFKSAGLSYLLHCLPGPMGEKAPAVFENVAAVLDKGGVVFGATILQGDAPRSWAAQRLMDFYNSKGIFSNSEDDFGALEHALTARFKDVELERVGAVALFTGRV